MPQFFPQILGVLEGSLQGKGIVIFYAFTSHYKLINKPTDAPTNSLLQHSCLSSMRVIFSSVSQFLSPYLGQLLHLTTHAKLVGDVCYDCIDGIIPSY